MTDAVIRALERQLAANPGDLTTLIQLIIAMARTGPLPAWLLAQAEAALAEAIAAGRVAQVVELATALGRQIAAPIIEAAIRAAIMAGRYAEAAQLAAAAVRAGLADIVQAIVRELGTQFGRGKRFIDAMDAATRTEACRYARSVAAQVVRAIAGAAASVVRGGASAARGLGSFIAKAGRFAARATMTAIVRSASLVASVVARAAAFLGPWGAAAVIIAAVIAAVLAIAWLVSDDEGEPNCDCAGLNAGILTSEWRKLCIAREDELLKLAAEDKLNLVADENDRLVSGEFCSTSMGGPRAWPVIGAPKNAPAGVPRGEECENPSGLTRRCD